MWPKILDLSREECRGLLRRLELDSYSQVIGTFRAQGKLNEKKMKILKDLREAFHISDDRHKAEIRRVVNDEYLTTVATRIYGPNSEIEWNDEGNRKFTIINRKPPQTALSVVANTASNVGAHLNKTLQSPSKTTRNPDTTSHNLSYSNGCITQLVTEDPYSLNKIKSKPTNIISSINKTVTTATTVTATAAAAAVAETKPENNRIASNATSDNNNKKKETNSKSANHLDENPKLKTHLQNGHNNETKSNLFKFDHGNSPSITITKNSSQINRRRKTITAANLSNLHSPTSRMVHFDEKPIMINDDIAIHNHQHQHHHHSQHNDGESPKLTLTLNSSNDSRTMNSTTDIDMNRKSNTVKFNARDAFNIADSPRVFEIIEGNTVKNALSAIKPSSPIMKRTKLMTLPKLTTGPTQIQSKPEQHSIRTYSPNSNTLKHKLPVKSFVSNDDSMERINKNQIKQIPTIQQQQQQSSTTEILISDGNQINVNLNNKKRTSSDFISIPTARNPNIVKTNDKTIMHVTPIQEREQQLITTIQQNSNRGTTKKQIVQVLSPQPTIQPRTVTIHPNNVLFKVKQPAVIVNETCDGKYEEQVGNWQSYDPSNNFVESYTMSEGNTVVHTIDEDDDDDSNIQHIDSDVVLEEVYADNIIEDLITEEYLTSEEYSPENVIEVVYDGTETP